MKMVIPSNLNPPPVPPGVYRATIRDYKTKNSKDAGHPQMQLNLKLLTQGPNAEIKTVDRIVSDLITITPDGSTLFRLNMPFHAVTGKDLPAGAEFTAEELIMFVAGQIIGHDVIVQIENREYEGQVRTNVKSYASIK